MRRLAGLGALLPVVATFSTLCASTASAEEADVRLVVGFRPGTSAAEQQTVVNGVGADSIGAVARIATHVAEVPAASVDDVARELEANAAVTFVERDHKVRIADVAPNDPLWPVQWGPARVGMAKAWDTSLGHASVIIAVLDTGVEASHPDLAGALVAGIDLVNGDTDPADDHAHGHGTSVAGIVAARLGNGVGGTGHCPSCSVMPVKVLAADGSGYSSTVALGITRAVDAGADIVNLSLSGPNPSAAITNAITYARSKGVVVVAAAGNESTDVPQYPAASAGVIGVAASDPGDRRYPWSNYGAWADLAAPGCHVAPARHASYELNFCGTSAAAPAVAGIAGLLRATRPDASTDDIEQALTTTAVPSAYVAAGRVDGAAAVGPATVPSTQPPTAPAPTAAAATTTTSTTAPTTTTTTTPPTTAPPPGDPVEAVRVAGSDRSATAIALSVEVHDRAPAVVVARRDDYADALAAAPLAATVDGPVLLTAGDALDERVAAEIDRLGADIAFVVGGVGAISGAVTDELGRRGVIVRRFAGVDRFDTAARIASHLGGTDAIVVNGSGSWADAVAASGLAATTKTPILLVAHGTVPEPTRRAFDELGIDHVTVVGGTAVVPAAVVTTLAADGRDVDRIAGDTRYATSARLAEQLDPPTTVFAATGRTWADALAAGAAAAHVGAVLLLVDGIDPDASPEPLAWLESLTGLRRLVVVGGEAAIGAPAVARLSGR